MNITFFQVLDNSEMRGTEAAKIAAADILSACPTQNQILTVVYSIYLPNSGIPNPSLLLNLLSIKKDKKLLMLNIKWWYLPSLKG